MKNKVSALYLGFNRSYTNPTAEIILKILGSTINLSFYGPGFSKKSELDLGLDNWIDSQKNFDFIIVDTYVFEADTIIQRHKPFLGDHIRFETRDFKKYSLNYRKFFINSNLKKILISNWDTYSISKETIDLLIESGTYILDAAGNTLSDSIENIKNNYGSHVSGNDNWFNFSLNHKHKFISCPHVISSSEFDFTPLNNRKYPFTIIGASYPERKQAFKILPTNLKISRFLYRLGESLRYRTSSKMSFKFLLNLRNNYLELISNSILCYCSGGPWLYPVRKYFEIPARGAVPVGWYCTGFENLGFKNEKNFIIAKTNKDILDISTKYSMDELQSIAFASRDLVWKKHSDWARATQLSKSFELILHNNFNGSYWENGNYKHY